MVELWSSEKSVTDDFQADALYAAAVVLSPI
jgi:hypothetical protein